MAQVGEVVLRKEVVDAMVKQIAPRQYKFKQAVAIISTNAWKNTFSRENQTIPAGKTGNATKGIPRGANFPQYSLEWTEVTVKIIKHGLEENINWEDLLSDDINVQARTIIKLTSGVVKSVDDDIWGVISVNQNQSSTLINTVRADSATTGTWDESSGAIIDNLMEAAQKISQADNNYDTSDLMCFVNPRDKRSIMNYLADKGAQWMPIATDIAKNGNIGKVAGVRIIESSSVSASYALVVKPKVCATYKELVSLRSTTIEDPYRSLKIRIVEEGVVEFTDPKAVCLIYNTQHA